MQRFRRNVAQLVADTILRAAGPDWLDEAMLEVVYARVRSVKDMLSRGYVAAMNQTVKTGRFTEQEAVEQAAFMVLTAMRAGMTNEPLPAVTAFRTRCRSCGKYHPYVECPECMAKEER